MNAPVEEIKSRLNIVDLVGAYVKLQKSGAHWKAPCPFHNEKTPSFMVNEERQIWHCFGCNKGGDGFSFLMDIEGIDFREALQILADKTGVELPKYSKEQLGGGEKDRTLEILELATKFYEKQLWQGIGQKQSLPYLRNRSLSDDIIGAFRLGYAPDGWRNIFDFLVGRGYSAEEIERTGLIIKKDNGGYYDRFRDRIMFPITDILGRTIGYSARVAPGGDETQAKYINTPETGVYHKSHVLYGIYRAKQYIKQFNSALLVEGNVDVIALHQSGMPNAVAVSGTALTGEQLALLQRYTDTVRLFFDMDGAGQVAARKSAELALSKGLNVFVVSIPQGKDAADAARENVEGLREAVESSVPALQYFLNVLLQKHDRRLPEGKREIVKDYLLLLQHVKHDIDRGFWLKKLSGALDVDEKMLADMLKKTQSADVGTMKTANESAISRESKTQSFSPSLARRSEVLRRNILGLFLLDLASSRLICESLSNDVMEFLKQDAIALGLFAIIAKENPSFEALIAEVDDEGMKNMIIGLYFEAEKLLSGSDISDEDVRKKHIYDMTLHMMDALRLELHKEKMARISKEIDEASSSGDKDRATLLMKEFDTLKNAS